MTFQNQRLRTLERKTAFRNRDFCLKTRTKKKKKKTGNLMPLEKLIKTKFKIPDLIYFLFKPDELPPIYNNSFGRFACISERHKR
jgi:hypothetical protein